MLNHLASSSFSGDASLVAASSTLSAESKQKKKCSKGGGKEPGERKKRKHADKEVGPSQKDPADSEHKKKKKRKGTAPEEYGDCDIDANAQASTAALLNAIVAAVSSATPPENPPDPQVYAPQHIVPQPHFVPFPLPFNHFPPGAVAPDGSFPACALNDLTFASNDDVLRALHNMDMSKFARGPDGPSLAANMSAFAPPASVFAPPPPPPTLHAPISPVNQLPVGSSTVLNVPKNSTARHATILAECTEQPADRHADLLATKWLNARKLAELVESEGLVFKKGKFSATEERQLNEAIEEHKRLNNLSDAQLQDIIFPKNEKNKDTEFWTKITKAVPQRPIVAVYHHVRRKNHPLKQRGAWSEAEDGRLKEAVADLGQAWEKVSLRVGRMASDCRDRYRNHIVDRDTRVTGAWSKEEEEELTRIVTDMTIKQGRDIDNDVFWSRVSQLMGGRRGRQQCRIKWTDSLSKLVKNDGTKPRWSPQDAFILVRKVDSLKVNDDTEIDWKLLPDPDWNLWSAHTLQRRWLTMKRSIKGYEEMTHQEIVDILRVKKSLAPDASSPEASAKERRKRKTTGAGEVPEQLAKSAPTVEDSDSE
ncbi:hypothetical protein NMY22_g10482 [Coprinellus aureogranulatus]|nr:hypothetical protein NMY22_g10482 [Coprinellus aureogranulatus]